MHICRFFVCYTTYTMPQSRLLSAIQPSGSITLGNYLGAIQLWTELQQHYDSLFFIVDLHAITVRQDPKKLLAATLDAAAWYIACGIDPQRATLFVQSMVPAHTELAWVLMTFTQMGELERMTQFKDKSRKHQDNLNAGLFTYPVLMAADIALYDTEIVPVGDDQRQHLELARNVIERFNNWAGHDVLTVPVGHFAGTGSRVMALDDPTSKMSKSATSAMSYIALSDTPDSIRKKISRAVTDTGTEICVAPDKPGITNLLTILSRVTHKPIEDLQSEFVGQGYGAFKTAVADAVIAHLTPIQERYLALRQDETQLKTILTQGAQRANTKATPVLERVKQAVGLGLS